MQSITIAHLQTINVKRVVRWHGPAGVSDWTPLEWAAAMAGEVGEACNAAKKLKRIEGGLANINHEPGRSLTDRVAACRVVVNEIADAVIYGALFAESVGESLEDAVRRKFNEKSIEYGFPERL